MTTTRIFIVTPCFNAAETIDQTIASVISQAGRFELHYHVQDGGSSDDTLQRLQTWKDRLENGRTPIFCDAVWFTYESAPDKGMYDAITRGFASFDFGDADWLTWINADDMLAHGAGGLLAAIDADPRRDRVVWVAGSAAVVNSGTIVGNTERSLCSDVIRQGLCDGRHWEFVQQEGTFFRGSLWKSIDPIADFASLKLAGDWNLWRCFARHAELHQVNYPLGLFHERPGQLSQVQRDRYLAEIDSLVPPGERALALIGVIGRPLRQKRLVLDYRTRLLQFPERDLAGHLKFLLGRRFGADHVTEIMSAAQSGVSASTILRSLETDIEPDALVTAAAAPAPAGDRPAQPAPQARRTHLIAHDADWQFPAVTEAHAFIRAKELLPEVPGVCYLAFPWATLFDHMNSKNSNSDPVIQALAEISPASRGYERVVTVCQHIHMLQYAEQLTGAGVTDVFWSHAAKDQKEIIAVDGRTLRIHPFPLYPVQAVEIDHGRIGGDRRYLFSFIGAKSNKWYLTHSREWILDALGDHPKGFVAGRDSWHYQKIVYEHQIERTADEPTNLVDDEASRVFRELLLDSVFSLCPSGSGPNSIRLWESIGAGSIPVILADTYQVPGNPELWNNAVVFCQETAEDIAALPERLEAIAADPELMVSMRKHLEQLWMLYGPDTFITDIHRYYVDAAGAEHAARDVQPLNILAQRINSGEYAAGSGLETFLKLCAGRLALDSADFGANVKHDRALRTACSFALAHCEDGELVARTSAAWTRAGLDLPDESARNRRPVPVRRKRVHLFGRHANRTPMHYEPYRRLFARHVDYVDDIWKADTAVTGFDLDIRSSVADLAKKTMIRPEMQFLVVSEEPLWDTVWSAVLTEKSGIAGSGAGAIPYTVANHVNSNVFAFDRLPYFITTEDKFFQRYALQFQRNAAMSADEVLSVWRSAPIRAAFYAERRLEDRFDLYHPELAVRGLCAWRTRVAEGVSRGPVLRVGQGWNSDAVRRQSLPDWHLDKLAALDRQALIVSGLENTHQPDYITEKPFDAFAVLGVPLYYAEPRHRIHEICPAGGFLNLYGHSEQQAAALVDAFEPDAAFARAYLDTQKALASLFSDPETLNRERARVVSAVLGLI
ncbi:MAG: exostosin family protein [Hyphomonas sp.]